MAREKQQVRLPELPVFKRFSLVLRQEFASAEDVLAALERSSEKVQKSIQKAQEQKRRERAADAKEPVVEQLPEPEAEEEELEELYQEELYEEPQDTEAPEEVPEGLLAEAPPVPDFEPAPKRERRLSRRQLREQREREEAEAMRREDEWREQERLAALREEASRTASFEQDPELDDWRLPIEDDDVPIPPADDEFPAWEEEPDRVGLGNSAPRPRQKPARSGGKKVKSQPQIVRVGARGKPLKSSASKKPAQKKR